MCADMRADRCTDMRGDICADMCADMRADMCGDLCADMRADMCADMRGDMCADMRADMRGDMCSDMCADMCADMRGDMCADMRLRCGRHIPSGLDGPCDVSIDTHMYRQRHARTARTHACTHTRTRARRLIGRQTRIFQGKAMGPGLRTTGDGRL